MHLLGTFPYRYFFNIFAANILIAFNCLSRDCHAEEAFQFSSLVSAVRIPISNRHTTHFRTCVCTRVRAS
uniref:Uncharacterized protein n=1 Tax=Glossina morsitans morsitans TaxID=37546 RepID=A0A1B0GFX8_GLOMM